MATAPSKIVEKPWCVWEVFQRLEEADPSFVALVDQRIEVTRAELRQRAEELDRLLRHLGVGRGSPVMLANECNTFALVRRLPRALFSAATPAPAPRLFTSPAADLLRPLPTRASQGARQPAEPCTHGRSPCYPVLGTGRGAGNHPHRRRVHPGRQCGAAGEAGRVR